MFICDDWFLSNIPLPWTGHPVPMPAELRAEPGERILRMLERISNRNEVVDVQPIPPARFGTEYPLVSHYFNPSETFAQAMQRFSKQVGTSAERADAQDFLVGLRYQAERHPDARIQDLARIVEGSLAALTRRGVLSPPAEVRAASNGTPFSLPNDPPKVGRQY